MNRMYAINQSSLFIFWRMKWNKNENIMFFFSSNIWEYSDFNSSSCIQIKKYTLKRRKIQPQSTFHLIIFIFFFENYIPMFLNIGFALKIETIRINWMKKGPRTDYDQWSMQTFEICVYFAKLTCPLHMREHITNARVLYVRSCAWGHIS